MDLPKPDRPRPAARRQRCRRNPARRGAGQIRARQSVRSSICRPFSALRCSTRGITASCRTPWPRTGPDRCTDRRTGPGRAGSGGTLPPHRRPDDAGRARAGREDHRRPGGCAAPLLHGCQIDPGSAADPVRPNRPLLPALLGSRIGQMGRDRALGGCGRGCHANRRGDCPRHGLTATQTSQRARPN